MSDDIAETPARSAYLAIIQVADRLSGDFSALFRSRGLTLAQFNVLRILVRAPEEGVPCQHIADNLVHRVPDVTRLVGRMEAAQLITRERCPLDRRVVRVRVTPQGRSTCEGLYRDVEDLHASHFEPLDADATERLDALLRTLLQPSAAED
jgi:MarR family transcriptional regulator, 2-MHQ and catechol-resistance regulon repressor